MKSIVLSVIMVVSVLAQTNYTTPPAGYTTRINSLEEPAASEGCSTLNKPLTSVNWYGGIKCLTATTPSVITKGTTYKDLTFGGVFKAITSAGQNFTHQYSAYHPLDASNCYVSGDDNSFAAVVNVCNNNTVIRLNDANYKNVLWDTQVGGQFYYINSTHTQLRKGNVDGTNSLIYDFPANGKMATIENGGSSQCSKDMWCSFWSTSDKQLCAIDILNVQVYCATYNASPAIDHSVYSTLDYTMTSNDSPSGRYVALMANPAMGLFKVNTTTHALDFVTRGPQLTSDRGFGVHGNDDGFCDASLGEPCFAAPHSGMLQARNGESYIITTFDGGGGPRCDRVLVAMKLSDGPNMVHNMVELFNVGYCSSSFGWPDSWYGCSETQPTCVISTLSSTTGNIDHGPWENQLIYMRDFDGTNATFTRIAGTHALANFGCGDDNHAEPRAGISMDGKYIITDANLYQTCAGKEQVFMIAIPGVGRTVMGGRTSRRHSR